MSLELAHNPDLNFYLEFLVKFLYCCKTGKLKTLETTGSTTTD